MGTSLLNPDLIWHFLKEVPDPEVPVLNIVDLGVVRDVELKDDSAIITITPTYSGCPAMKVIEDDIKSKLTEKGLKHIEVKTILTPAWTTDWITDEAKEKLREYGIAPPEKSTVDKGSLFSTGTKTVACPYCKSTNTEMRSQFGSTACKALYFCNECMEPFDYFKCI